MKIKQNLIELKTKPPNIRKVNGKEEWKNEFATYSN